MGLEGSLRTILLELERKPIVGKWELPAVAENLEGDEEESHAFKLGMEVSRQLWEVVRVVGGSGEQPSEPECQGKVQGEQADLAVLHGDSTSGGFLRMVFATPALSPEYTAPKINVLASHFKS